MNQGQPKVQPVWHSGHHICLSAVSCDFLHQEILAFRCIGRLLGGPFGQKAPACRCTCRWRRRFRLVFPPLPLGILLGKTIIGFLQNFSAFWAIRERMCGEQVIFFEWLLCLWRPASNFASCVIGITPNVLLRCYHWQCREIKKYSVLW